MNIELVKSTGNDAELIFPMQVEAFKPLLEKYQDYELNPANETIDRIRERIDQPFTDYYLIKENKKPVGAIRIVRLENNRYRVSPIFILPEHQGKGIAQETFRQVENIYIDAEVWELTTIKEEAGNCYLYEKIGYRQTGWTQAVNEKMTLVGYEKCPDVVGTDK